MISRHMPYSSYTRQKSQGEFAPRVGVQTMRSRRRKNARDELAGRNEGVASNGLPGGRFGGEIS
jgi:hypothetical protein